MCKLNPRAINHINIYQTNRSRYFTLRTVLCFCLKPVAESGEIDYGWQEPPSQGCHISTLAVATSCDKTQVARP